MRLRGAWKPSSCCFTCSLCISFLLTCQWVTPASKLLKLVRICIYLRVASYLPREQGQLAKSGNSGAGDTTTSDCNALLTDTLDYDVNDDIPEQRNALIEFYNATGGQYWSSATVSSDVRANIQYFEMYLIEIGDTAAQTNFSLAYLPADLQAVFGAVEQLSVNCTIQRTLQLVNLLTKYAWNTPSEFSSLLLAMLHADMLVLGIQAYKLLVIPAWVQQHSITRLSITTC